MTKKRVPLTLNFDWTRVVGYAEVDTETGEITGHITSETAHGAELAKLMSREVVRACTFSFEFDGRRMREDEMRAVAEKFHRRESIGDFLAEERKRKNFMHNDEVQVDWDPKPKAFTNYEHDLHHDPSGCS